METIKITCESCNAIHEVTRDNEAPKTATSMGCNWCPRCEDNATEYYEEWYNESESGEEPNPPYTLELFPLYPDERDFNKNKEAAPDKTLSNENI